MIRHSLTTIRAAAILAVALNGLAAPAAAQSGDGARWQQSGYDNDQGGRNHTLTFGIPQTDAWALDAVCEAGAMGPGIPLMLALDFGGRRNGEAVDVRFQAGDYQATFAGSVSIQGEEYAGVRVMIGVDDPFWNALRQGDTLQYGLAGEEARSVSLSGASAPLRRFLGYCQETFAATDASAPAAPEGPFSYQCEDGSGFDLTIDNSRSYSVATLASNGNSAMLVQVPSGSGTLYSNGVVEMHTKGDEALMITPQETVRCVRR